KVAVVSTRGYGGYRGYSGRRCGGLVRVCFTFIEIKSARSALLLVCSFIPANQSAERALVSSLFNVKQTRTKGTAAPPTIVLFPGFRYTAVIISSMMTSMLGAHLSSWILVRKHLATSSARMHSSATAACCCSHSWIILTSFLATSSSMALGELFCLPVVHLLVFHEVQFLGHAQHHAAHVPVDELVLLAPVVLIDLDLTSVLQSSTTFENPFVILTMRSCEASTALARHSAHTTHTTLHLASAILESAQTLMCGGKISLFYGVSLKNITYVCCECPVSRVHILHIMTDSCTLRYRTARDRARRAAGGKNRA
ncbi:hypothetical protein SFRURICE_005022, partial [Spodoptera frugiperda]